MSALLGHDQGHAAATTFLSLAAMWLGMMAAMMAPAVWPWVRAFERLSRGSSRPAGRVLATVSFSSGYLAAWSVYAGAAAFFQMALARAGALDPLRGLAPVVGAGVLIVAGLFQFAPLKRACLSHCRSPLSYFVSRWRNGPMGGFRLGLGHGLFCVGCCWALMATALAVGVMNLWWMAALAAAAFVEQVTPRGNRIRAPLGVALIVAGLLQAGS